MLFFKALKGIVFHFLCLLCVSYYPDLKCSWVIYEHLSCVSSFFIKSVLWSRSLLSWGHQAFCALDDQPAFFWEVFVSSLPYNIKMADRLRALPSSAWHVLCPFFLFSVFELCGNMPITGPFRLFLGESSFHVFFCTGHLCFYIFRNEKDLLWALWIWCETGTALGL